MGQKRNVLKGEQKEKKNNLSMRKKEFLAMGKKPKENGMGIGDIFRE